MIHSKLFYLLRPKRSWLSFAIEPITSIKSTKFIEKEIWWFDLICEKWDLWAQWEYTCIVSDKGLEIVAWIQENIFNK